MGFSIKLLFNFIIPWVSVGLIYPDMKSSLIPGNEFFTCFASSKPFIPGITTSANRMVSLPRDVIAFSSRSSPAEPSMTEFSVQHKYRKIKFAKEDGDQSTLRSYARHGKLPCSGEHSRFRKSNPSIPPLIFCFPARFATVLFNVRRFGLNNATRAFLPAKWSDRNVRPTINTICSSHIITHCKIDTYSFPSNSGAILMRRHL